jgi:hypothetical protein
MVVLAVVVYILNRDGCRHGYNPFGHGTVAHGLMV